MRNFGFSGATDLFVFVGGYTAAILYGKMMLERGFVVTATRIFKRLWQLYAAYIVLFVIYIDLIGYVARKSAAPELIGEFNVTGIVDHTIRTLIHGLLLQAKPLNLDVLQLFIVLMAFFPFVLIGMMRRPNLTAAGSISLYLAARHFDWNLSSVSGWTLVFQSVLLATAVCAGRLACVEQRENNACHPLAAGFFESAYRRAAVSAVRPGRNVDGETAATRRGRSATRARRFPAQRQGKYRPRTGCCIFSAWLSSLPIGCRGTGAASNGPVLQPLLKCGEEWLPVFCAGVFLSFTAHFILITGPDSLAMHALVSLGGISAMTGVAYYVSWSRRQDQKPAQQPDTVAKPVVTARTRYGHGSIGWRNRPSQISVRRRSSATDRPATMPRI